MKKLLIIILSPFCIYAQVDSTKVSFTEEKVEHFEKTTLIDEYEKAFGGNRIVKSGLRMRTFSNFKPNSVVGNLEFEKKLNNRHTLIFKYSHPNFDNISSGLEFRKYLNTSSNINGRFVSLEVFKNNQHQNYYLNKVKSKFLGYLINYDLDKFKFKEDFTFTVKYGTQFGNSVEIGINAGVKYGQLTQVNSNSELEFNPIKNRVWTPFLSTNAQIGFGILFPITKNIPKNSCEFLMCNYSKTQLFKLNIQDALYIDKYLQKFKLDFGYEKKLGKSPFSFNNSINVDYQLNNHFAIKNIKDTLVKDYNSNSINRKKVDYFPTNAQNAKSIIEFNSQLRYYISQHKKVQSGLVANNLNGFYTGIGLVYAKENTNFKNIENQNVLFKNTRLVYGGILGYQTLTNKKCYLDYSGFWSFSKNTNEYLNSKTIIPYSLNIEIKLKLGLVK